MTDPSLSWQYVLGTTETEHDRLMRQAARLAPHTGALFREAGLTAGHRVLDIGSGVGDVALLAARIVGSQGEIVGIDRDGAALAIARERAKASGLQNVRFVEADVSQFAADKPFDAIVGRLTLQFVPRPVEILATLASALRPGGVMIFQESNWEALLSQVAHLPLRKRCCELIYEASNARARIWTWAARSCATFPRSGSRNPSCVWKFQSPTIPKRAVGSMIWSARFTRVLQASDSQTLRWGTCPRCRSGSRRN
jgi:ubiquinone/menaquinone biosynthesis C-methylase UbiE